MKLAINKAVVNGPWGGGNQILMLLVNYFKKMGIDVVYKLTKDVDVILIMDSRQQSSLFSFNDIKNHKAKVVQRINDTGSHRKNDKKRDGIMLGTNKIADRTIFISEWVKNYYCQLGFSGNGVVINNAADRNIFKPISIVRQKNTPIRIVTHHWSGNDSKGYDFYKKIDDFCDKNRDISIFRFIGKTQYVQNFSSYCDKIGVKKYVEIPSYLQSQDLYLSASLFEAGGCHIVEGMACGLIPLVRKGGGGTESYSEHFNFTFSSFEDLQTIIIDLYNDYDLFLEKRENVIQNYTYTSEDMCKQYFNVICN